MLKSLQIEDRALEFSFFWIFWIFFSGGDNPRLFLWCFVSGLVYRIKAQAAARVGRQGISPKESVDRIPQLLSKGSAWICIREPPCFAHAQLS